MKSSKRNIVVNAGFGLALAIFVAIGSLYYVDVTEMTKFDQMEDQSYEVILDMESLIAAMKDVEIGELAFILTGEEKVLEPYRVALGQIDRNLAKLKSLTKNYQAQQNRVERVEPLIREKLAEVAKTIDARRREGFQAAYRREFTDQHELLADEVSRQLDEARDVIRLNLKREETLHESSTRKTVQAFVAGNILSFALLISTFILLKREISKRIQTEEELRKTSMQNELILASAGDGIIGLDLEGNHTFVNVSAAAMLGYEVNELVGKQSHSIWHYAKPDGSLYSVEECPVYGAYRDGVIHSGEEQFWRKDGTVFPVEFTSRPIRTAMGVVGAVLTFNDITERKRMEDALRKSEEKLSKIFHSVPALIGISTLQEGKFIDVNKRTLQLLGYHREEMIGKTSQELGIWVDEYERAWVIQTLQEEGSVQNFEVRFRAKSGQCFPGLLSAELIVIDDELYMLSLMRDISDLKQAEEKIKNLNTNMEARAAELEAVNRELEAFNYTIAHDLRRPLNQINSYCQAIKEMCGNSLDEQCRSYLQMTYDGTLNMSRLIEALLNFSRLGSEELHREKVDLCSLAQAVAEVLRMSNPGRRVTFRIAEGVSVSGDADLLRVVLDNLLGNSWKYTGTREEALIEFGVMEIDGKQACFIRDNGTGFAMANADKLFTPFRCLPGDEKCRGFGVGLATVEKIIRRHGGKVWAEGEPGMGATFYFTLP